MSWPWVTVREVNRGASVAGSMMERPKQKQKIVWLTLLKQQQIKLIQASWLHIDLNRSCKESSINPMVAIGILLKY
jgi:hypothetical protein